MHANFIRQIYTKRGYTNQWHRVILPRTKSRSNISDISILRIREVLASQFCGYSCLLLGKGKGFQYTFTGLEFIHTYTTRARFVFFALESSAKCKVSLLVPICVHDSTNFLNDPLKHFSPSLLPFSCLSSSSSRASLFRIFDCLRSSCSFPFAGETSLKNATTYNGLFSPSSLLSAHFEESFCISNSNSCKDSTCPTAARSFFDAARTVPMTFLIKFPLLLSTEAKFPQRIWVNPKRFVNCD